MEGPQLCPICKNPRSQGSASLTQWIVTCACESLPTAPQSSTIDLCVLCGKRMKESKDGSFTQLIFSDEVCSCDRSLLNPTIEPVQTVFRSDLTEVGDDTTDGGEAVSRKPTKSVLGFQHSAIALIVLFSLGATGMFICSKLSATPKEPVEAKKADTVELENLTDNEWFQGTKKWYITEANGLKFYRGNEEITDIDFAELNQYSDVYRVSSAMTHSVTGTGLAALRRKDLRVLQLIGTATNDAGLLAVSKFPKLEFLEMEWSEHITETGMDALRTLTHLKVVRMGGMHLPENTFKVMSTFPELEELDIVSSRPFPKDISSLKNAKKLHTLKLNNTDVSDKDVDTISSLGTLKYLYLRNCRITDAALKKVKKLALLRLDVSGNKLTNAGVSSLASMKTLRDLFLCDMPQISAHTFEELDNALPQCRIVSKDPTP